MVLGYKIVYYTTREVKIWPVQSTCKLANMCPGVALFISHSRFGAGSASGTFGQGMVKKQITDNYCYKVLLNVNNQFYRNYSIEIIIFNTHITAHNYC